MAVILNKRRVLLVKTPIPVKPLMGTKPIYVYDALLVVWVFQQYDAAVIAVVVIICVQIKHVTCHLRRQHIVAEYVPKVLLMAAPKQRMHFSVIREKKFLWYVPALSDRSPLTDGAICIPRQLNPHLLEGMQMQKTVPALAFEAFSCGLWP